MTHYRKVLRKTTKEVLREHPFFETANLILPSAKVDHGAVPCWSVSTPSEDREDLNPTTARVATNLVVALHIKALADELEDDLDDYSEVLETALPAELKRRTGAQSVLLRRTETKPGAESKDIIGSLMMLFEVVGYIE